MLEKVRAQLDQGKPARGLSLPDDEEALLKPLLPDHREADDVRREREGRRFENNAHLDAVRKYAESENAPVVAVCAAIEAEIADLDEADKAASSPTWAWTSRASIA